jgi:hypothetical protein
MPYMIPYFPSGLLVKFRCTDCDWTYRIQDPLFSSCSRRRGKSERIVRGSSLLRVFNQDVEGVAAHFSRNEPTLSDLFVAYLPRTQLRNGDPECGSKPHPAQHLSRSDMNFVFLHRPDGYLAAIVAAMFLAGLFLFIIDVRQRALLRDRWISKTPRRT